MPPPDADSFTEEKRSRSNSDTFAGCDCGPLHPKHGAGEDEFATGGSLVPPACCSAGHVLLCSEPQREANG